MAFDQLTPLPDFNGVAAGQTATVNLDLGPTYDVFYLEHTVGGNAATIAQLKDNIEEVLFKINSIEVRRYRSGEEIIQLLEGRGIAAADGFLTIPFAEFWRETLVGVDVFALGTLGLGSVQITVKLKSGITNPTLKLHARQSPARDFSPIKLIRNNSVAITTIGENLFKPVIDADLEVMHFKTDDLERIRIKYDDIEILNATPALLKLEMQNVENKEPINGFVSVDFNLLNRALSKLDMQIPLSNGQKRLVKNLNFYLTTTTGDDIPIIEERIGLN